MITATIIILIILFGFLTVRQFFKKKSASVTTNDKTTLVVQTLIGIVLILIGLFLTFGIIVYSLKEHDNNGFFGFFISLGLTCLGIYFLWKSKNLNQSD